MLTEEYPVTVTHPFFGSVYLFIPEGGIVVIEKEATKADPIYVVEYDGYSGIEIPSSLCEVIPDVDYTTFEEPVMMRACSNWESDCPYQPSVRLNQLFSITRENEDYFYGELVVEGENDSSGVHIPRMEGWIQKSLLT